MSCCTQACALFRRKKMLQRTGAVCVYLHVLLGAFAEV